MASAAIMGDSSQPVSLYNKPAAVGMSNALLIKANPRFCFMLATVAFERPSAIAIPHRHRVSFRWSQHPHGFGHPALGAGILVNHHASHRHAFAFDTVFAPDFASFDHASTLKHALEPAIAVRPRKLGLVLAVKVRHVPTRKAALVQLHNGSDDPRSSRRRLLEISSSGSPARSRSGLWGRVASLLHKPDRLLAKNRTTQLLPTQCPRQLTGLRINLTLITN